MPSLTYLIIKQRFLGRIYGKLIDDFKNKGYNFNHIEEVNIITIAIKLDMTYDFCIKHKMHAVEWKLNAMINKNKSLIDSFNRNWRYPLNRNFESFLFLIITNLSCFYTCKWRQ